MEEPSATPVIGHDHEIVGAKQIGVGLEDVVDAVTAGSLFVGNENQAKGEVGGDALRLQFLCNEQAANDGLLIVLHATATDPCRRRRQPSTDRSSSRKALPEAQRPYAPESRADAATRRGCARPHWGARRRGPAGRARQCAGCPLRRAHATALPDTGLWAFRRAAVLRAESGEFRHAGLVFDDLVPLLSDGLNKPRKTCHMFLVYGFGK